MFFTGSALQSSVIPAAAASKMRASRSGALFLCLYSVCLYGSLAITAFFDVSGTASAAAGTTIGQAVTVLKVIDGDTVILQDRRHIRLIGVNTPETGKKGRPDQPLARAAKRRLQRLINTGNIKLSVGKQNQDRHGRTLAYLHAGTSGVDIQEKLLAEGLAWLVAIPPNISRIERYSASQALARKNKRGIWAQSYYQPREASKLGNLDTGFLRVRGKIKNIGRSRKYVYLNFNSGFSARIAHQDWRQYFPESPEIFSKKTVIVSGWISKQGNDKLGMRIGHPAMIEIINN